MKMLYIPDRLTHIQIIVMIYYTMFSVVKKKKQQQQPSLILLYAIQDFFAQRMATTFWEHPHHLIRMKYLVFNHQTKPFSGSYLVYLAYITGSPGILPGHPVIDAKYCIFTLHISSRQQFLLPLLLLSWQNTDTYFFLHLLGPQDTDLSWALSDQLLSLPSFFKKPNMQAFYLVVSKSI